LPYTKAVITVAHWRQQLGPHKIFITYILSCTAFPTLLISVALSAGFIATITLETAEVQNISSSTYSFSTSQLVPEFIRNKFRTSYKFCVVDLKILRLSCFCQLNTSII